jgi:acetyltransferase-like isoleucine patch superfamily enzyme
MKLLKRLYSKVYRLFSNKKKVKTFEQQIEDGDLSLYFHGNNKVKDIKVGKYSYVSYNSIIYHAEIGNYCSIGPNVVIGFGDHPINMISTSPYIYLNEIIYERNVIEKRLGPHFKKVIIKNDVWIGANVYIRNGVRIGNGAVVGAGSVVTKDVPDYAVIAGVPAKIIKMRFNEKTIALLLRSKWWRLDSDMIKEFKEILDSPTEYNIEAIIKKVENS